MNIIIGFACYCLLLIIAIAGWMISEKLTSKSDLSLQLAMIYGKKSKKKLQCIKAANKILNKKQNPSFR